MTADFIPFNLPAQTKDELKYVSQALNSHHLSGDGDFTRRCNTLLEGILGAPKALITTSCTHALEMSALLLDLKPGDVLEWEVEDSVIRIVPRRKERLDDIVGIIGKGGDAVASKRALQRGTR